MPWFYDSRTGAYAEESGVLGFFSNLQAKFGLGWHQYSTKAAMQAAIKANNWPPLSTNPSNPVGKTIAGSGKAAVKAVTGTATGNTSTCLVNIPLAGCVLTKTQGRAMIAGLIIGVSGVVTLLGVILIVAEGFRGTGVGQAASKTVGNAKTLAKVAAVA